MKTKKIKYCFRLLFVIVLALGLVGPIEAQNELDKTSVWKYKINDGAVVLLKNYECDVEIETTGGNEVKFEVSVYAEASDEKDIKKLQDFLENQKFSASGDRVELSTQIWEKMNSINFINTNRSAITLLNGEKITLSDFEREAKLTIPESVQLVLESKYSELNLDDIHNLKLKSYNDKIYGGDLRKPAEIEAKYSKMEFEELADLSLDLYDCTFEAESSKLTSIKSKYSKISMAKTSTLSVDSYDDKFEIEETGDMSIKAKYSDFSIANCGHTVLEIYDSNLEIESLKNLTIKESKYSDIEIEKIGNLKFIRSYDDEITTSLVNLIEVDESKYSTYKIEKLEEKMTLNGYDDNISIDELGNGFKLFETETKYGKIYLGLSNDISMEIDIKTKYGKLNFDKEEYDTQIHIKQDDELEYKGVKGKKSDKLPKIKVRGYDVSVTLEN